MSDSRPTLVLLGNQLFPDRCLPPADEVDVYLAEDFGLCTFVRHHQQKIVLFLAAMRQRARELEAAGYSVHYRRLGDGDDEVPYVERLVVHLGQNGVGAVRLFEVEDRWFESELSAALDDAGIDIDWLPSPMFLCSRERFTDYLDDASRPFMAEFYKRERRHHGIMIDPDGKPQGGQWSFDEDNREKLPRDMELPEVTWPGRDAGVREVIDLVAERFGGHPGDAHEFCWPASREAALAMLDEFLDQRFGCFGPYQDALTERSATTFHSLLAAPLNMGMLTPNEVVRAALDHAAEHGTPINSLEGFVRQLIGWREFIRGIDRHFGAEMETENFFDHQRGMTEAWHAGGTGIPLLDLTIERTERLGWAHHIERLMVAANLMNLAGIHPRAAYRWFMERFVDSSDWVMAPNVYGMGLFSDGGVFATKPYVCGANYLKKMSDVGKGDWCDVVDGLYWGFVARHRDFFKGNPRLAVMPATLDRMGEERKKTIGEAADKWIGEYTTAGSE